MMKTVIGLVVLAGVVYGIYALNTVTRTQDGKSVLHVAQEVEVPVEVTVPEQRDIVKTVQAPGTVEPFSEVDISAEVVGKIIEMPVEEGNAVKKGDLLCRLDDADYEARLLSAKANVARLKARIVQAQAEYDKAQRDVDRQKRLSEQNATSELELADYLTALVRAKSFWEMTQQELIQAEAAEQSAQEDLERTVITSPITGVVSQRFAKEGEVVITGTMNNPGTRIMVISDLSKMQVRCRVDESDAPLVREDHRAGIYLQSETLRAVPGRVYRVATKGTKPAGRDVVTFETLVMVESDDKRVKPGMTASVEIEVARSDDALTIPVQSIVNRKRDDLPEELVKSFDEMRVKLANEARVRSAEYIRVAFVERDGVAHPRLIETGISDERSVEVVKGLVDGERVVIGPYRSLDQLKDGTKLKIEEDKKEEDKDKEKKDGKENDDKAQKEESQVTDESKEAPSEAQTDEGGSS